jgi:CubicO group peptidase (beta-lactamase class C family)
MTKLFTRIAIWQLEQQGRLSLSDTLGKFLPGYHNAIARREVTVAQLLEHRSGIGSFWNKRFMERHEQVRTVNDYVDLFQDDSLLFPPGSSMVYSNGGYVLLGAIIEKVSGQSYHDYLRDHVFAPAGMSNTMPYERGVVRENAAVGYTFQSPGPVTGDARLAGPVARPGSEERTSSERRMIIRGASADSSSNASPPDGAHLRLIGPDGKELSPEQTRAAMAQAHRPGQSRQPNTGFQPGMSGPAGDDYSTARDLVSLATALTRHVLLDSARTAAVLGSRYAAGGEFRANGGGPGVNSELSIYPSGEVLVVLSNYDPPSATTIAQFIRARMPASAASPRQR